MLARDIADLFKIRKADVLRALIQQMAIRTGRELNVSSLSRELGIARDTMDAYLSALEHASFVLKLAAWRSNESLREIKQPKYHFVDSGMNCALRGLDASSFDLGGDYMKRLGGLTESWVANELVRALPLLDNRFHLYHWRSADRREIDIIAEAEETIIGIEVKASPTITRRDFKHLKWFAKDGPGRARRFTGIVLHLGEHKLSFGDNCFALPVSSLWADIDC